MIKRQQHIDLSTGLQDAIDRLAPVTVDLRAGIRQGSIKVDREHGILGNVAIITEGAAIGHRFFVDSTMLVQVSEWISQESRTVKCRLGHPDPWGGEDTVMTILGTVENGRIDGKQVRGDIHFGDWSADMPGRGNVKEYLFKMAESKPQVLGLSISFVPDWDEMDRIAAEDGGLPPGRVKELIAIDFVGDPGANPAGLLSRKDASANAGVTHTKGVKKMKVNKKQLKYLLTIGLAADAEAEAINAFIEELDEEQLAPFTELAAKTKKTKTKKTEQSAEMSDDGGDTTITTENLGKIVDERVEAARAKDRARATKIREFAKTAELSEAFAEKHIQAESTMEEVSTAALAALREERKPLGMRVGDDLNRTTLAQGIGDAILLRSGGHAIEIDEFTDKPKRDANGEFIHVKPHERSLQFRRMSLVEMGRAWLRNLNIPGTDSMPRPLIIDCMMSPYEVQKNFGHIGGVTGLAQSTGNFPLILADVMGKSLRAQYEEAIRTSDVWTRHVDAPDFKDIKRLALSESPNLELRAEGAEIQYVTLGESSEVYALSEFTSGIIITRRTFINDDLDAFARVPGLQANAASRKIDDVAYATLTANANMADGNPLFDATNHNNLITAGGSPSSDTLSVGRTSMRKQTGPKGSYLNLTPHFIICPVDYETTVNALLRSDVVPGANQGHSINIWKGTLVPVFEARLSADSTVKWYLMAHYNQIDTVEVATLEGESAPVLKQKTDFDTDDVRFAVRHTCAAKPIDWRGIWQNDGS